LAPFASFPHEALSFHDCLPGKLFSCPNCVPPMRSVVLRFFFSDSGTDHGMVALAFFPSHFPPCPDRPSKYRSSRFHQTWLFPRPLPPTSCTLQEGVVPAFSTTTYLPPSCLNIGTARPISSFSLPPVPFATLVLWVSVPSGLKLIERPTPRELRITPRRSMKTKMGSAVCSKIPATKLLSSPCCFERLLFSSCAVAPGNFLLPLLGYDVKVALAFGHLWS